MSHMDKHPHTLLMHLLFLKPLLYELLIQWYSKYVESNYNIYEPDTIFPLFQCNGEFTDPANFLCKAVLTE